MEQVFPFEPGPDNRATLTELERRFAAFQQPIVDPDGTMLAQGGCSPGGAGLYAVSPYDPYASGYSAGNGA